MKKQLIENIVEDNQKDQPNESWVRKAYREEWPTMGNHAIACVSSIALATGFSAIGPEYIDSDAAISGIATALDAVGYWGTFIPQLLYRDRDKLYDDEGKFSMDRAKKKTGEYLGYIGLLEGTYAAIRFTSQYFMQKNGIDPVVASASIQGCAVAFFTGAWPLIRFGTKQWSEK